MNAIIGIYQIPVVHQSDLSPFKQDEKEGPLGFPVYNEEVIEWQNHDLSRCLIKHTEQTYFIKTTKTLPHTGIKFGDVLIVEQDTDPRKHDLILAWYEGDFILRRIDASQGFQQLYSEVEGETIIDVEPDDDFAIWGVVKDFISL